MASSSHYEAPEDATGQAGWMFSDMLIALMVVFLATISFIPQFTAASNSTVSNGSGQNSQGGVSGSYTYTEHFDKAFIRAYKMNEVKYVLPEIADFEKANGIPGDAVISSAQFVGGYTSTEQSSDAIKRAIAFSNALEKFAPNILEHASTILNSSPKLSTDLITVRLTFSAKVNTN